MKTVRLIGIAIMSLLALSSGQVAAQENQQGPQELIEATTERVLQVLERHQAHQNQQVTEAMAEEMLQALQPAVDFNAIARGIMGEHLEAASEEQRQRFTRVLKNTLAQLYIDSLDEINVRQVEVLDLPPDFNPETATSASVQMRATTQGGETYTLTYSMRKTSEDGWKVLNIIAGGVNLGLTYRSQFDDLMNRHQNIDRAIASWPKEVEEDTEENPQGQ